MASVRTGMQRGQRLGDGTFGWNSLSEASAPLRTPPLPRRDVSFITTGRSGGARVAALRWPVYGVCVRGFWEHSCGEHLVQGRLLAPGCQRLHQHRCIADLGSRLC